MSHRRVGDDLSAPDHHHVVGGFLQFAHQMARHQDRAALGGERAQEPAHPHDALRVHAVERLVEQERRWVAEQRGGDPEPLPHAEREAAGPAPGDRPQAGLIENLVDAPGGEALRVGEPEEMAAGGPAGLQRRGVEQGADVAQRVAQAAVGMAVDEGVTGVGPVEAEDDAHGGGLARAVRADEPGDLPRPDGEGHPVEGDGSAEPFAQPVHSNHGSGFYACAGVIPVPVDDTGLTPGAWHREGRACSGGRRLRDPGPDPGHRAAP
ncbi:hypothetical protein FRAHR75_650004 [Frankia sp. Hr75.2]|nr:hypothetical protein FRAHR75_650004 [Frankia sp. Hr75.2]